MYWCFKFYENIIGYLQDFPLQYLYLYSANERNLTHVSQLVICSSVGELLSCTTMTNKTTHWSSIYVSNYFILVKFTDHGMHKCTILNITIRRLLVNVCTCIFPSPHSDISPLIWHTCPWFSYKWNYNLCPVPFT